MCTAIFSECAVEAWLSSGKEQKLISFSFFATLGHLYTGCFQRGVPFNM
jgi:hypothetical protein